MFVLGFHTVNERTKEVPLLAVFLNWSDSVVLNYLFEIGHGKFIEHSVYLKASDDTLGLVSLCTDVIIQCVRILVIDDLLSIPLVFS